MGAKKNGVLGVSSPSEVEHHRQLPHYPREQCEYNSIPLQNLDLTHVNQPETNRIPRQPGPWERPRHVLLRHGTLLQGEPVARLVLKAADLVGPCRSFRSLVWCFSNYFPTHRCFVHSFLSEMVMCWVCGKGLL